MKKLLAVFCAAISIACFTTGCVPNETNVAVNPDFHKSDYVQIDFNQLHNDALENLAEVEAGEPYLFIRGIDVDGNDSSVVVKAYALHDATEEDCKNFASAMLRMIADAAAVQDLKYEGGDNNSFGSFYDSHNIDLTVYDLDDESEKYVLTVEAGKEIPLSPDYEKYVDEWLQEREVLLSNAVYDAYGNIVTKD